MGADHVTRKDEVRRYIQGYDRKTRREENT